MSMDNREKAVVSKAQLGAYAAACAAVVAGTQAAEAGITVVNVNAPVADTVLGGGAVGIDLLFGATPHHLTLAHGLGTTNAATGYALVFPDGLGVPAAQVAGLVVGPYSYVSKVAYNTPISGLGFLNVPASGAATMAFNVGYGGDQFLAAGIGYLGVKFNTNQYGWVRVQMNGAPLNSFTVLDYAYADAGESINAGQTVAVPEPGSLAGLALGAMGLLKWRGNKRKVAA